MTRLSASGAVAVAVLAAACGSSKLQTVVGCSKDSDCGSASLFSCDTATGACLCLSNAACSNGQFCNAAGDCQTQVTCFTNADCPASEICDYTTNECVAQGRCFVDDECPVGEVCMVDAGSCEPGCRDYGDCQLGQSCLCVGPDGGPAACQCNADAGRMACSVGQCSSASCPNTLGCPYGELCGAADGGTQALPTCYSDYNASTRPYCDACTVTPGQNNTCGVGANFCIYDTDLSAFGTTYCGADCSQGQLCPNGYGCSAIVVVRSIGCSQDSDCPKDGVVCTPDGGCPENGLCQVEPGASTGLCSGRCYKHEGESQGFCTCVIDDECDQSSCDDASRTCTVTQEPCDPAGTGCPPITCVPFRGFGGCLIGHNCAPDTGLSCADVRPPGAQ